MSGPLQGPCGNQLKSLLIVTRWAQHRKNSSDTAILYLATNRWHLSDFAAPDVNSMLHGNTEDLVEVAAGENNTNLWIVIKAEWVGNSFRIQRHLNSVTEK